MREPNILSDHCLLRVEFDVNINNTPCNDREDRDKTDFIDSKYIWYPDKGDLYRQSLSNNVVFDELLSIRQTLDYTMDCGDIDVSLSSLISVLHNCLNDFQRSNSRTAPNTCKKTLKASNPWFDDICKTKGKLFYAHLTAYKKDKNEVNRFELASSRSDYKKTIRQKKYMYNCERTRTLDKMKSNNPKEYWELLKGTCTSNPMPPMSDFVNHFKSLNNPVHYTTNYDNNYNIDPTDNKIMFQELNEKIEEYELDKAVNDLKLNRSTGPDRVTNEFLIQGYDYLKKTILSLFNACLSNGYFPPNWSEGYIVPLHKKGNVLNAEIYRGITPLSCIGKLFTKVLNNRLTEWAEKYHVYIESQAAFRSGMGTTDNIFGLSSLISLFLQSKNKLYTALIDFSKAFDYVVRDHLWKKLTQIGIRGNILNVIKSMYSVIK